MKILVLVLITLSIQAFADDLNEGYFRVMGCQTPDANLYMEVFHDQQGFMGAPTKPTGYLVIWATTMGKDTQKRIVMDVPMKHITNASGCVLDIKWSQRKGNGVDATSNFNAQIAACNMMNTSPKGTLTQNDVYKNGKVETLSAPLNCQLQ